MAARAQSKPAWRFADVHGSFRSGVDGLNLAGMATGCLRMLNGDGKHGHTLGFQREQGKQA
jgi:hypothetical protein